MVGEFRFVRDQEFKIQIFFINACFTLAKILYIIYSNNMMTVIAHLC